MTVSIPVVLVVDTGVDDALALVVAALHPALDLHGVVCTGGNVQLHTALANMVHVLGVLEADVPVAAGADRALDGTPFAARAAHGRDGLAGLAPAEVELPASWPPPSALVRPDVVVVSLGPLTSLVGLAFDRVVATYARPGETNHDLDPVAGRAIDEVEHVRFRSGAMAPEAAELVRRDGGPLRELVAGLLTHQARRGVGLGDAAAVLWLAEPGLDPALRTRRLVSLVRAKD